MQKPYAYHKPSPDGLLKITALREAFSTLDAHVTKHAPSSRERSLALTKLEEAAMWAIRAIVINDPKSEVDMNEVEWCEHCPHPKSAHDPAPGGLCVCGCDR